MSDLSAYLIMGGCLGLTVTAIGFIAVHIWERW